MRAYTSSQVVIAALIVQCLSCVVGVAALSVCICAGAQMSEVGEEGSPEGTPEDAGDGAPASGGANADDDVEAAMPSSSDPLVVEPPPPAPVSPVASAAVEPDADVGDID